MAFDYTDYVGRLTELSGRRPAKEEYDITQRIASQHIAQLTTDPTWNVYFGKLQEARENHRGSVVQIGEILLDYKIWIGNDKFNDLRLSAAFSKGFISAIDFVLNLVLADKQETKSDAPKNQRG